MEFGCFHNPRVGRCIKDASYRKVDSQCEVVDAKCQLKTTLPMMTPMTGQSTQATQTTQSQIRTKIESIVPEKANGKISGPISAFATNVNGKVYNFYGDAHYGMENICKLCKDFDIKRNEINPKGGESCWDISRLLAEVFTKASNEKKWVDFYIEIPFLSAGKFHPSMSDIEAGISEFGYLYKLFYIFYNCMNKISCKYDTVRFHYVDVRLQYQRVNLPKLTEEMQRMITIMNQNPLAYTTSINNYEMHLSYARLENAVKVLKSMILRNIREKNRFIEDTDKLMKDFYFSGGQTMAGVIDPKNYKLFLLYLTSDNYAVDARELMKESFSGLDAKEALILNDILVPPSLMVNRRGKNMHRIRAQIEALEYEGVNGDQTQTELANKIVEFLKKEYKSTINNNRIIDLWKGIMIAYEGYINAKYRTLNDLEMLIDKFEKEFDQLSMIGSLSVSGNSLLMDAYTLARMFRKYPNKDPKKHIDSSKVIAYAGAYHIKTYVKFFEETFSAPFVQYDPNPDIMNKDFSTIVRCIDVYLPYFL